MTRSAMSQALDAQLERHRAPRDHELDENFLVARSLTRRRITFVLVFRNAFGARVEWQVWREQRGVLYPHTTSSHVCVDDGIADDIECALAHATARAETEAEWMDR